LRECLPIVYASVIVPRVATMYAMPCHIFSVKLSPIAAAAASRLLVTAKLMAALLYVRKIRMSPSGLALGALRSFGRPRVSTIAPSQGFSSSSTVLTPFAIAS